MTLRIGRLLSLHAEPCYTALPRPGMTCVELSPSAMAAASVQGTIDAGPIPLVACAGLQDTFEPVAGFCIASVQPTGCCLLHATRPLTALGGAHIAVPDEAATSRQLLRILLRHHAQVQPPAYVSRQVAHDAVLLTGHAALRQRLGGPDFPYTYDLGALWHDWTGLPLVWARWLVRKTVPPAAKAQLAEALYLGLEDGVERFCQLATPRPDLRMLPRDIVTYIQGFRYFIGRAEQQAIETLEQYLQQLILC